MASVFSVAITISLIVVVIPLSGCDEVFEAGGKNVPLLQFPQDSWEKMCISSQHEIPDLEIRKIYNEVRCWGGEEVRPGYIYLSFFSKMGECMRLRIRGHFFHRGNSETRCFDRDFASTTSLAGRSGIYSLEKFQGE